VPKWFKRALLGALAVVALVLMSGLVYEQWSRRSVFRDFAPVSELLELDGRRVHLRCTGEAAPTVILEAGFGPDGSESWASLISDIASVTRVCSYDRAGILWSDRGGEPRDAYQMADELHALLGVASESPPYVMVGHSLGGPLVRVFADRYQGEVSGFVFVDASHPEQIDRLPPEVGEVKKARTPPLVLKALAALGVMRLVLRSDSYASHEQTQDVIRLLLPRTVPGLLAEADAMEVIFDQAAQTPNLDSLPVVVLSAGRLPDPLPPGVDEKIASQTQEVWMVLQRELAALSSNSDHRIIEQASHYIHHEDAEAVLTAITDVVTAVREGTPVRRTEERARGVEH